MYKIIDELNKNINNLNYNLIKTLGKKSEIIKRNLLAGIFRGVGIGIGVTIITAIIVIVLQKIVLLNLPVIGEYITDIVNIVQKNVY